MSWGERSCTREKCEPRLSTMHNCNVDCVGYVRDMEIEPDSRPCNEPVHDIYAKALEIDTDNIKTFKLFNPYADKGIRGKMQWAKKGKKKRRR